MIKINDLKTQLGTTACLSENEALSLKGGNKKVGTISTSGATTERFECQDEDDKRRERPGGLTSQ